MVPREELCNGLIGVGDEGRWMARAAEDDFRDDGLSCPWDRVDVVQDSLYGKETAQAKIHRPAAERSLEYQWTLPRALQMLMRCAHGASSDLSPLRLNALVKGVRPRG